MNADLTLITGITISFFYLVNSDTINNVSSEHQKSLSVNSTALHLTELQTSLEQNGTSSANLTADDFIYGYCLIRPNNNRIDTQNIKGSVIFRQPLAGGATEMRVNLTGFSITDAQKSHGFHVHEYGDLSQGCDSVGLHFNPLGVTHGSPEDSPEFRHFGDLGNVKETLTGEVHFSSSDYLLSLLGPFSILGRSIVFHDMEDDLGRGKNDISMKTGNSGGRLACCTIGLSDGRSWLHEDD